MGICDKTFQQKVSDMDLRLCVSAARLDTVVRESAPISLDSEPPCSVLGHLSSEAYLSTLQSKTQVLIAFET